MNSDELQLVTVLNRLTPEPPSEVTLASVQAARDSQLLSVVATAPAPRNRRWAPLIAAGAVAACAAAVVGTVALTAHSSSSRAPAGSAAVPASAPPTSAVPTALTPPAGSVVMVGPDGTVTATAGVVPTGLRPLSPPAVVGNLCTQSELTVSTGAVHTSGSQSTVAVIFTNSSTGTCTVLADKPAIQIYSTPSGGAGQVPDDTSWDTMAGDDPISLSPGASGSFTYRVSNAENGGSSSVTIRQIVFTVYTTDDANGSFNLTATLPGNGMTVTVHAGKDLLDHANAFRAGSGG